MMMKDIEGYEHEYAVTDNGQVWSYKSNIYLKPLIDKDGYFKVSLSQNSQYKQFFIHRLVAQAFIPNIDNKPSVDHIDGNITNNHVSNLKWATFHEQNMNEHWQRKRRKAIRCIETGVIYDSITQVNKELGLNMGHLSECVHGKRNTCGSYHWEYVY